MYIVQSLCKKTNYLEKSTLTVSIRKGAFCLCEVVATKVQIKIQKIKNKKIPRKGDRIISSKR